MRNKRKNFRLVYFPPSPHPLVGLRKMAAVKLSESVMQLMMIPTGVPVIRITRTSDDDMEKNRENDSPNFSDEEFTTNR